MTKRHWITAKECKDLYGVNYGQLKSLIKHGVVVVKEGTRPLLHNHRQVKVYGDLNRSQRLRYMMRLNGTKLGRPAKEVIEQDSKVETDFSKTEEYKLEKDVYSKDYNKWRKSKNWSSYVGPKDKHITHKHKFITSVDQPEHYNPGKIPVIDAIEDWNLNFSAGNVVKYLVRAGRKDKEEKEKDLQKALWYLIRMLKDE